MSNFNNNRYVSDWINSQPIINGDGKIMQKGITNKNPLRSGDQAQRFNQSFVETPQSNLNKSASQIVLQPAEPEQPNLQKSKSCKNFYQLEDSESFAEQVDSTDLNKDFKQAFVGVHGKMLGMKNQYQVECAALTKEKLNLQRDLRSKNSQLEYIKTAYQTTKDELENLNCELRKSKEDDRAKLDNAAETESKLAESESKLLAMETENEEFRRDNLNLQEKVTNLTVNKLQSECKLANLESTVKTLRGSIKYRDDGLSEKILKYDELFDRCEKGTSQVLKLAANASSLYEEMDRKQTVHLKEFNEVSKTVENMGSQLCSIQDNLEAVQRNEMSSIESILKSMLKIVRDDLSNEIAATTHKREELNVEHSHMNDALHNMTTQFRSYYARISKEVKKITTVGNTDFTELTVLVVAGTCVGIIVGFFLCYFYLNWMKRF